ncbi:MAG: GDP-mannose 4,6-dehydratase, partial [Anaerolineales bacterium]
VYDEAKRYAEAMTMAYHRYHDLDTRIVRIFNTYGPRLRLDDGRVVPNFICQALEGEDLTVYGDGSQTRSFCYVDDLVEGLFRLLMSDYNQPVNLGNPTEMTIAELAEVVLELTDSQSELTYLPERRDSSDPDRRKPDISRAKEVLGWEPEVDLRTGLRETIEDFKARL